MAAFDFFLLPPPEIKISDHQQSVAAASSRGLPHTPSSAAGR